MMSRAFPPRSNDSTQTVMRSTLRSVMLLGMSRTDKGRADDGVCSCYVPLSPCRAGEIALKTTRSSASWRWNPECPRGTRAEPTLRPLRCSRACRPHESVSRHQRRTACVQTAATGVYVAPLGLRAARQKLNAMTDHASGSGRGDEDHILTQSDARDLPTSTRPARVSACTRRPSGIMDGRASARARSRTRFCGCTESVKRFLRFVHS
ncbi:hypothetical protein BD626DRAFT_258789 [Schizophyllum amplum]|uniref:Uncharacterized protein n=1 Tax=Schizophyllum amplum TaxID=97359 RepID=A0A550BUK4_9AGAR|nr:hypothetical protein BD626DRAFT_258789 [Auriculariopsis ampla]